jgi:hypothetical protein
MLNSLGVLALLVFSGLFTWGRGDVIALGVLQIRCLTSTTELSYIKSPGND